MTKTTKLLLVEDEALIALEAQSILSAGGYEDVSVASDLSAARSLVTRLVSTAQTPDVAVLDLNLGGESGLELAVEIADQGVPLVITTGYHDAQALKDELNAVVVEKPYDDRELLTAIESALGKTV